jgi:hypothetical protein
VSSDIWYESAQVFRLVFQQFGGESESEREREMIDSSKMTILSGCKKVAVR